jgi:hypothetical protein
MNESVSKAREGKKAHEIAEERDPSPWVHVDHEPKV